jgi:hypothetical protein
MKDSFTHDQTTVLITSLIDMISVKNEEIELNEAYTTSLYNVIDQLNDEIASLKTKLKAKSPKVPKITKVTKEALPAPVKRKPGRPKKVTK